MANNVTQLEQRAISPETEAKIFWKLRRKLLTSQLQQTIAKSRLRAFLVCTLSIFFWVGLFTLFFYGFSFLTKDLGNNNNTYQTMTIELVFHLFFASLNIMLIFSAGIILYSGLFRSSTTTHLLTTPASSQRIVLYHFQETIFFSSWGFLLLGSPMLFAYGVVVHAPWYYYILLLPMMFSFVYIPCGIGALVCIFLVHRLPKFKKALCVIGAIVLAFFILKAFGATFNEKNQQLFDKEWLEATQQRFQITRAQLLPSTWLTAAVLGMAKESSSTIFPSPFYEALKYLGVLIVNALFIHILVEWIGSRQLRTAYCSLQCWGRGPARTHTALIDRILKKGLAIAPMQVRLLLTKDFRVFRRDPVQWSQFLIFFGLLLLYFLNMDRFGRADNQATWVNMISFLNLAVVGLILSTFTTRFIFPMISLEGSRFWILGLLPIKRTTIVWGKFCFAAFGAWIPCGTLVFLSDLILHVSITVVIVHQLTCIMLSVGLSAIAVGLGAAMPSLNEKSPSKIAAGFGGTINLVVSAAFILVTTLLTALPVHFYTLAIENSMTANWLTRYSPRLWLIIGLSTATFITLLATIVPLYLGLKSFRKMEF